jgi:hypothetical protein
MRLAACAAVVALAGCAGGEPQLAADPEPSATATATATPDPKPEIRRVASQWLEGVADGDAKARCAALAPSERRHFDRLAGSCERAIRGTGTPHEQAAGRRIARRSKVGQILVYRAGYAAIAVEDDTGPYLAYYAIKENGRWGLARKKRTPIEGDPPVIP